MVELEDISVEYILKIMEENNKEIENLTLQNIGFEDELNRRILKWPLVWE